MIHFFEVKKKTIETIKNIANENCIYYIVRDVFGRINIYIKGALGEEKRVAENLPKDIKSNWLSQCRILEDGFFRYIDIKKDAVSITENIFWVERGLVKTSWNNHKKVKKIIKSKVVSFYSYKGGLGRTTTLAMTALQLVRKGAKVVVVDFDLEAPGIASILKPINGEYPLLGVTDYLLECNRYDKLNIDEYVYSITSKKLIGMSGGELYVMQATNDTEQTVEEYYNKLTRLDFGNAEYSEENNPIDKMLLELEKRYMPDYIFLDLRSGIHDIGGITLTEYSDDTVLFFYGNHQNMFGLDFVLSKLVCNKIPFTLINSPVPVSEEEAKEERDYYIRNAYEILIKNGYYDDDDDIPDVLDESAAHIPQDVFYDISATLLSDEDRIDYLLNQKGEQNPYKIISNIIQIEKEENIKNGITNKKNILNGVKNIAPDRTPVAETEFHTTDDFKRKFYPLRAYRYIFEKNKFLILGPKGCGKTALFLVLKNKEYVKNLAQYLEVNSNQIDDMIWITGLDKGKSEDFPDSDNFLNASREFSDWHQYRVYWQCLAIKKSQSYIKKYLDTGVPAEITEIFNAKFSEIKSIIKGNMNISEKISDVFSELDKKLMSNDKIIIFTYDALDAVINKDIRGKFISALINWWYENITRYENIRSKIFLREDIYNFEVSQGMTDKVKINNYRTDIGWKYDYLLAMIWKRVLEENDDTKKFFQNVLLQENIFVTENPLVGYVPPAADYVNKEIIKRIIGERMGKGKKAFTYNWIFNKLADTKNNIVPRSILKLFITSAKYEISQEDRNSDTGKLIRPKSLENSLAEVSYDRLVDLKEEYSEYEEIFKNLKNFCPNFPVAEEEFKEGLIQCGVDEKKIETTIDALQENGILKKYQRRKTDPIRYHIPDIYLRGLGLSRKGAK